MGFSYFSTQKHHHEYRCGPAALGPVRDDLIGSFADIRLVLLKSGTLTQLFWFTQHVAKREKMNCAIRTSRKTLNRP